MLEKPELRATVGLPVSRPNFVTVVYVGFDDGDDLGMKGSDSAMPIWADFMRDALSEHPEWNGDWQMPDTVRKAEIDVRDGKLIRELTDSVTDSRQAQQTVLTKDANVNSNVQIPLEIPDETNIYVSSVPTEFRRVELFISGTLPNKALLPSDEITADENTANSSRRNRLRLFLLRNNSVKAK
ncbi:MAG: hypothetical protein WKG07_40755 [Hymenobacter sp.]